MNPDPPSLLKRDIGLIFFVLYGAGNIIGAGIYVLVGKVAGEAGLLAPVAFIVAALIAGLSGLSYGELAARFPKSAGEAVYLHEAFRLRWLSITVGLCITLAGLVSAATMARGFVGYFAVFLAVPDWVVILVLVGLLTLLAIRGIVESVRVAAILTLLEAGGLLWVVAAASPNLEKLAEFSLGNLVPMDLLAWQGVLGGAFLAFFAFIGFEDMVNIAEEVKDPQRTIPRGIILAFFGSALLYVLIALSAVTTLPPDVLAASDKPLADIYVMATGRSAAFISIIGLVAVTNGALIQIIMAARIIYGMSRKSWLPPLLGQVSQRTRTPVIATWLAGALVLLLALGFPLIGLAQATSAIVLAVFATVNFSLLRIRLRDPIPTGVRPVPMAVPLMGAVASVALLVFSMAG